MAGRAGLDGSGVNGESVKEHRWKRVAKQEPSSAERLWGCRVGPTARL